MMKLASLQQRLGEELNASDRLRYGIYSIAGLVTIWIWLLLADVNVELKRSFHNTSARLADLQSVGDQGTWEERLGEEQQIELRLRNLLWSSATENQTLAVIQSTIRSKAEASGVSSMSVTVGSPQWLVEEQGLKQVRTRIRARGSTNEALKLIALLEEEEPQLYVEKLSIKVLTGPRSGGNRINVDVLAYFSSYEELP